jgi:glycosyltransferase involved in cell wall biosynthesis
MRIALIASSLRRAGAEKQFSYMARGLFDAGIDSHVFYLGGGDYYQTVLTRGGIPVHQIFNPGQPFLMLIRLIKQFAELKPDIVLASQFGDLIFAGLAGRLCGALVLGGVRSDGFYEIRTSGRRSGLMLRLSHGLVANSYRAKGNLVFLGIKPQKIAVTQNVIDLADFDQKITMPFVNPIPAGRIPVTAIGSLQNCKRFDRFLDGLALARRHEPALFGIIAGDDLGEQAGLERKAKDLGLLPDHLRFLGECDQVPSLLAHSRMLVSCSEYEGFPNVILEAMAARLPVLTTPTGDAARIVKDGATGFVLKPDDAQGMADAIVNLVRNPELANKMGEAGRKQVEQAHDLTSLAPRLMSVFSDFARTHGKRIRAQSHVARMADVPRASEMAWPSQFVEPDRPVALQHLAETLVPPIGPKTESSLLSLNSSDFLNR